MGRCVVLGDSDGGYVLVTCFSVCSLIFAGRSGTVRGLGFCRRLRVSDVFSEKKSGSLCVCLLQQFADAPHTRPRPHLTSLAGFAPPFTGDSDNTGTPSDSQSRDHTPAYVPAASSALLVTSKAGTKRTSKSVSHHRAFASDLTDLLVGGAGVRSWSRC